MHINWNDATSLILMNTRYTKEERAQFGRILIEGADAYPGHIWLATSGSSQLKWVGLSKQALLASAQAVNAHLHSTSADCWIQSLPPFHVGAISIYARSYISGAHVLDFYTTHQSKWNPVDFCVFIQKYAGTLTSLVPAQLYDLIVNKLEASHSLRAVIIGGGSLPTALYDQACSLGWPILPSYGMTECGSQIATAELGTSQPRLRILPHVHTKTTSEDILQIKGPSLFSVYARCEIETVEFLDPKQEGWFISEDRVKLEGPYLVPLGRQDHMIKIGGESVDVARLEGILQNIALEKGLRHDVALVSYPDERLGNVLHFVTTSLQDTQIVIEQFNQKVLPFERIRQVHEVPYFPKSDLSKVLRRQLLEMVQAKQTV